MGASNHPDLTSSRRLEGTSPGKWPTKVREAMLKSTKNYGKPEIHFIWGRHVNTNGGEIARIHTRNFGRALKNWTAKMRNLWGVP